MSSDNFSVRVESLGKCYQIYDRPQDRLRQAIVPRLQAITGRTPGRYYRDFWALRDVSFEVGRGETIGIIGRNGSGKSTLLQVICGTLAPTTGRVQTRGRVAALLELGAGFNPDFTGRENVYMNGTVLGLSQAEIDTRFDDIAAFADIGDFIEQPVKHYSSGMYARLAFAVAISVDPDILVVDEALAVGDAKFQKKCFRRLDEIKSNGATILFVSHSTEQIRSFCDHGLVLDKGEPIFWGDARQATVKYLASIFPDQAAAQTSAAAQPEAPKTVPGTLDGWLTIRPDESEAHTFGVGGASTNWCKIKGLDYPNILPGGRELCIRCDFSWDSDFLKTLIESGGYDSNITLGITLSDKKGTYLFGCNGFDTELWIDCLNSQHRTVEFELSAPHLAEGDYFLGVAIALGNMKNHIQLKWHDNLLQLKYIESNKKVFGTIAIDYTMTEINL